MSSAAIRASRRLGERRLTDSMAVRASSERRSDRLGVQANQEETASGGLSVRSSSERPSARHARGHLASGWLISLGLVRFYPNPYGLRGIEGVLIPGKSKSFSIRIDPLQSVWIENNRTSP
jgi:hypothetical protein